MKTNENLLNDMTLCCDLTEAQIEGHHPLYDLATENGHASLRSLLNDQNLWSETVGNVARRLTDFFAVLASDLNGPAYGVGVSEDEAKTEAIKWGFDLNNVAVVKITAESFQKIQDGNPDAVEICE